MHVEINYGTWTRAIGERFFVRGRGSAATYLSFDNATLEQLAVTLDCSSDDFFKAVSSVIVADDDNPFLCAKLEDCGDEYYMLGILAAQVYVAASMGRSRAFDASAYWEPFRSLFTGGLELRPKGLTELDNMWLEAKHYYEAAGRGSLAIQRDPKNMPHVGWRHINFPLWQALLRDVDRAQIALWLRDNEQFIKSGTVLDALIDDAPHFNRKLAQTLKNAKSDNALHAALLELIEELPRGTADAVAPRTRAASRLRLAGRHKLSCTLQKQVARSDWIDVASLTGAHILAGYNDATTGAMWAGDDYVLFRNGGNFDGWISHRGSVSLGETVLLLSVNTYEGSAAPKITAKPLVDVLEPFKAHLITIEDNDAALLEQFGCTLSISADFYLDGGLLNWGKYLSTHPPRLMLTNRLLQATLDGPKLAQSTDGVVNIPVDLPPGVHKITVGQDVILISIENGAELEDSRDGNEVGTQIDIQGVVCSDNVEELKNTTFLVGAYLSSSNV